MINTRLNALGRAQRLQIYPNPAADFLMVNLGGIHAAVMLSVVDVYGQVVERAQLPAGALSKGFRLDLDELGAGGYVLMIAGAGVQVQERFIKT